MSNRVRTEAHPLGGKRIALLMHPEMGHLMPTLKLAKWLRDAGSRLAAAGRLGIERRSASLGAAAGRLHALSPLATLARGYAVARDPSSGRTLGSVTHFSDGMPFDLRLRDGIVKSTAQDVRPSTGTDEPRSG